MSPAEMPPFEIWERDPNGSRAGDPLWTVQAYRLAMYAIESHALDALRVPGVAKAATFDQLTRAIGSIAANLAEGYSRASALDRRRFYSYALGSAREAIAWYDTMTIELGPIAQQRQGPLVQIRRLLLTTLRRTQPGGTSSMRD
jgi:four helix bundle protein